MDRITSTRLDCGATLITEKIPGVRSAGLTWLVPVGVAREPENRLGCSAMWSELLFRGAGPLGSREQADAFDALGCSRGTKAETFFQAISATMLGSRLDDALGLITDMVRRPRMDDDSVEPSRDLCLQAIESLADDPQERVMHLLRARHAAPPINRSSLGTVEGISALTGDELRGLWKSMAAPGGSYIGAAGDVDHARLADRMNALLDGWAGAAPEVSWSDAGAVRGVHHEADKTNQVQIALAHDSPAEPSPDAWPERLVAAVLSGGMSGRLFTEVREKRSLCYSVWSSYGTDARYGRTVAYVGTTPERAQESLEVLLGELRRINTPAGRITADEFKRAVAGMKSRLVFSGESTGARASALAHDMYKLGRARSLDELAGAVDGLTLDGVNEYLGRRSLGRMTCVSLGPAPLAFPA